MTVQTQLIVKIDEDTKRKFSRLARQEGKTTSTVVRELIEKYVRERDIASYIDGLWDRIGSKIRSKGVRPENLARIVREARTGANISKHPFFNMRKGNKSVEQEMGKLRGRP